MPSGLYTYSSVCVNKRIPWDILKTHIQKCSLSPPTGVTLKPAERLHVFKYLNEEYTGQNNI